MGTLSSPPLAALLNHTLLESDNLYAECLLRSLGNTTLRAGSLQAGLDASAAALDSLGVSRSRMVHAAPAPSLSPRCSHLPPYRVPPS